MPNIKTFCRIKPTKETYEEHELTDKTLYLRVPEVLKDFTSTYKGSRANVSHEFNFNYIFRQDATQEQVFQQAALDIVNAFLNGYNGTIFAYGQTGTGKTYTVEGNAQTYESRGLEPRALSLVYKELEKRSQEDLSIHISYLEIYQEVGYDLLNPGLRTQSYVTPFPKVSVLEGHSGNCIVRNLSNHLAASEDVAQNLLLQGQANRKVAATAVHERSSRSHAVFTIQLTAKKLDSDVIVRSKLNLVDLAGSERVAKTQVSGKQLTEAKSINLSLHYLETVIVALQQESLAKEKGNRLRSGISTTSRKYNLVRPSSADGIQGPRHVPYRNSLLTMLLRDSLGGNCMTTMIATISLEIRNLGESISTCRFAGRVACIANAVSRNEELDDRSLIRKLRKRIAELETELACLKLTQEGEGSGGMQLTQEDKEICIQVVRQYLSGKITDPVAAGVTNPYKFRECLRILKRVISKNRQTVNGHGRSSLSVTLPTHNPIDEGPDDFSEPVKTRPVDPDVIERRNKQKLREERDTQHRDNDSVNVPAKPSYHREAAPSRSKGNNSDMPQNDDAPTRVASAWTQNSVSFNPEVSRIEDEEMEDRRTKDPETLSLLLQTDKPRTPFEQKRRVEIKKLSSKVEKIESEKKDQEQQVMELKVQVAEKELNLMEKHMRTKLAVTSAQVEDQKAYIKQLTSTEADPGLIEQERLVERQLRKRQDKFERQLDYIEHRREQLKKHVDDEADMAEKKASVQEKFGQFRKRDGSLNTRQVFQMLKTEEKKVSKAKNQVEREKLLAAADLMEMKELATRQRLQDLKEAMKSGTMYQMDPGLVNGLEETHASQPPDARASKGDNHNSGRVPTMGDNHDTSNTLTNGMNGTRDNTGVGDVKGKGNNKKDTRPASSTSTRSNVPGPEFYARRKQDKDPTSKWESNYSRPTTPSNMKAHETLQNGETTKATGQSGLDASESKVLNDRNTQEKVKEKKPEAGGVINKQKHEGGGAITNEMKNGISDEVIESQSKKIEEELYHNKNKKYREKHKALFQPQQQQQLPDGQTLMPSEYVYGMSNTEQFDARKMGLSSKNFDSALDAMLGHESANLIPNNEEYDQYARTSRYRPNPYLEAQKVSAGKQRSRHPPRPPTEKTNRDRSGKTGERKPPTDRPNTEGGSPISAKISRYLAQSPGKERHRRDKPRPSSAGGARPNSNEYDMSKFLRMNSASILASQGNAVEIEEERPGKITAMEEKEREQTYMGRVQVERDRVNRIRKARMSAEMIQRAWRRYVARGKRRNANRR